MHIRRLSAVLAFCFAACYAFAQLCGPAFRHFGVEEGLPTVSLHQFLMDANGYGWVAGTNGLSRFDGYRFTNFTEKDGLTDDVIAALDEGQAGQIWILSNSGKVFLYAGDSLRACACNRIIQGLRDRFLVPHDIRWNPDDQYLYIALGALGILRIKPDGSDYQLIRPGHKRDLLAVFIRGKWLVEFRNYSDAETNGTPMQDAGVEFQQNGGSKRLEGLTHATGKTEVGTLLDLGNNGWLIFRQGYFYWAKDGQITGFQVFEEVIRDLKIGPDGALWMALPDKRELRRYADPDDLRTGRYQVILKASARSFYFDPNGGLWVATIQEGLYYAVHPGLLVLTHFNEDSPDHISTLCEADSNQMFIGFIHGRQYAIRLSDLSTRQLPAQDPADGMVNANIWVAATGELWGGKRALAYFDGNWKNLMLPAKGDEPPKPCRAANSIQVGPDGKRIWACSKQMFVCIDATTHRLLEVNKGSFEDVLEDRQGRVWVATEKGLFRWENKNLAPQNQLHPALATGVTGMLERRSGQIAFTTKTGLLLWNDVLNRYDLLRQENGLPENQIGALCEDEQGNLWAGCYSGAVRIRLDASGNWEFRRLNVFNGLPSNQVSSIAAAGNRVWLGTSKGLAMVVTGDFEQAPAPRPVRLTMLQINQKQAPLPKGPLQCGYDENHMHLEFNNLDFGTGRETLYRFRLQTGQPWEYTSKPEINLFSLAPGDYLLEIAASDAQGKWSESTTLEMHINPPFWQTWWFRLLVLLAVAIPALLFYRYRVQVLQRELSLREQSNELEKQALRAQMNPHFIFNCLHSIQDFILSHNQSAASAYLAKFAQMIRQVLDQSFQKNISLEAELEYLENYMQLERMRFKDSFQYDILVDPELEPPFTMLPPMLVQPFLENAILHGMRGKKSGGKIELRFEALGETGLRILILDNGPGFPAKPSGDGTHVSRGSGLAAKRLSLLEQHPGAGITLENRTGGGAQVTLLLPG